MSAGAEAAESARTSSPTAATEQLPPAPNGPAFVTPASYLRPLPASRPSSAPKTLTPVDKEQVEALVSQGQPTAAPGPVAAWAVKFGSPG